ncbi:MAG: MFS transporter [Stenotrophomonas sp.]|uniref:MFS transporter n=1 Tax=Stenotrophomonas sp. TaxID=69392 RepID=UPI0029B60864|nr:MFS transporter [Stenotrophomonas sp.]MDX3932140.1 MFS transporter [Stenotrophomonas sp.]
MSTAHDATLPLPPPALPGLLVPVMAAGAGFSVASLYYAQPMLGAMGASLGASDASIGLVPTLTQLGYAAGIALLAPLGDRFERRRIILVKSLLLGAALLAAGLAGHLPGVLLASLLVGLMATVAQDVVPAAATLAPPEHRGALVGKVMTGLLLGILLSRVVSGVVAEQFGWRAMFIAAAVSVVLMGVLLRATLPRFAPTTTLGYGALLRSMGGLWMQLPPLRRAVLAQALLAMGFSAFWSTLALMLHARFGIGSAGAGAFGIAGAAGALAAPLAGRFSDRIGTQRVARLAIGIALLGFASLLLDGLFPVSLQLVLLAVSAVIFDFGFQAALVSHQTLVYGLQPQARSRLNALLFTGVFVGMAAGGGLGAMALAQGGWHAVVLLACATSALALWVRR